jgi:hypothetical protein
LGLTPGYQLHLVTVRVIYVDGLHRQEGVLTGSDFKALRFQFAARLIEASPRDLEAQVVYVSQAALCRERRRIRGTGDKYDLVRNTGALVAGLQEPRTTKVRRDNL